jgi:hypothetical protein
MEVSESENKYININHYIICIMYSTFVKYKFSVFNKIILMHSIAEWTPHFPAHAQGLSAPLHLGAEEHVPGGAEWMKLSIARHYLKLSMAAYGWPLVMYLHCFTGCFRLIPYMSCCGCLR